MWQLEDISFELEPDATDDPVITIIAITPAGRLTIMIEPEQRGAKLILRGLDIQGASANVVGLSNLRVLAQAVMKELGVDEIIVEGAVRTTGAMPGRTPGPIRFSRRP